MTRVTRTNLYQMFYGWVRLDSLFNKSGFNKKLTPQIIRLGLKSVNQPNSTYEPT